MTTDTKEQAAMRLEEQCEWYHQQNPKVNVEYSVLPNGIGIYKYTLETPRKESEVFDTTPLLLLPGFANPQANGGEFGQQVPGLLLAGAREITSIHYPFDKLLKHEDVFDVIENTPYPKMKLIGLSLGADLTLEYLHRLSKYSERINDILLLSPYMIAPQATYGGPLANTTIKFIKKFPYMASSLWGFLVSNKKTDTAIENLANSEVLRESFTLRNSLNITRKTPAIRTLWTTDTSIMGEFASLEMRKSIEQFANRLALVSDSQSPFTSPHGGQGELSYAAEYESQMIRWYVRQKFQY